MKFGGQHKNFKYDENLEGTRDYVFGCKAGPSKNIFNLSHEVAHFVQLSDDEFDKKMIDGNLIFHFPKEYVYDRFICEPETDQISRRELETFVIQWLMNSQFNKSNLSSYFYKNEIYNLFSWLPDWIVFHRESSKNTDTFKRFVRTEAKKFVEIWSVEKIKNILNKRLNNWYPVV